MDGSSSAPLPEAWDVMDASHRYQVMREIVTKLRQDELPIVNQDE